MFIFKLDFKDNLLEMTAKEDVKIHITSSLDEIEGLIEQRERWYRNEAIRRFSDGDICFLARKHQQTVGCLWVAFNQKYLPHVEYLLRVDDETAIFNDGYVIPDYRGKKIFPYLVISSLNNLKKKTSYKRIYSHVASKNWSSLIAHKNLNFEVIMIIRMIKFLGLKKHIVTYLNGIDMEEVITFQNSLYLDRKKKNGKKT